MKPKTYTTKRLLIYSIVCFVLSFFLLPFFLLSLKLGNETFSVLVKVDLALVLFLSLSGGIAYLVYYLRSRNCCVMLDEDGVRFCNCAVYGRDRKSGKAVDDVTIVWNDISDVRISRISPSVITLKSGEKISVPKYYAFRVKVWKEIKTRSMANGS